MRSLSLFLALGLSGAACTGSTSTTSGDDVSADEWDQRLNERVLDYSAALRTAALRLTGDLPTLAVAPQFSRNETRVGRAPFIGEHNRSVLRQLAGLDEPELDRLHRDGVLFADDTVIHLDAAAEA